MGSQARMVSGSVAAIVVIGAALWVWLPPQVLGRTLIDGPIVTLAIGVSVCFVILVCGSAAFAPARRAGRLDPLTIMRADE